MTSTTNKNTISIFADGDIFIIPNRASKLNGFMEFAREGIKEKAEKLAADNDTEYDELTDWFVETWICSDELETDNLADHGFAFMLNGSRYSVGSSQISRYLLHHMIDVEEDDIVTVNFNDLTAVNTFDSSDKITVNLSLTLKANQLDYRYRNFGDFHRVMMKVCC